MILQKKLNLIRFSCKQRQRLCMEQPDAGRTAVMPLFRHINVRGNLRQ